MFFCYIIRYSLTLISPTVTCHFGGQAHNTAVELERAKPNNEKAVTKKALPPTVNQPKIDHVCDKNMSEGYIKLFCTAYTLTIEPTLPLSQFTTLVKMQRENDDLSENSVHIIDNLFSMTSSFPNILLDNSFNFDYPPDIQPTPFIKNIVTPQVNNTTPKSISCMEKFIAKKYDKIKNVKQPSDFVPTASSSVEKSNSHFNSLAANSLENQIESLKS